MPTVQLQLPLQIVADTNEGDKLGYIPRLLDISLVEVFALTTTKNSCV